MVEKLTRFIRRVDLAAFASHVGPGQISGCIWNLFIDENGRGCGAGMGPWPRSAVKAWQICYSYRAPLITALSWSEPGKKEDEPADPQLIAFARSAADELGLLFVDAHQLQALDIPWGELPPDAELRLDWSNKATGFNLLFYEY